MPTQQPTQQAPQTLDLTGLTIDEINIVMMGLVKLPYETSAQLVDKVRMQASMQINQMQKPAGGPEGVNVNVQ
jgi:hypothetical protein